MNTRRISVRQTVLLLALLIAAPARAAGPRSQADSARAETLENMDGSRVAGALTGDRARGFRFEPAGPSAPIRLEKGSVVTFDCAGPAAFSGPAPFRIELGLDGRISGRLGTVGETKIELVESSAGAAVSVLRGGARGLVQRPGEIQVIEEGFESIDGTRWAENGDPDIVNEPRVAGRHSLKLPAGGSSMTARLADPIGTGRLDVSFHDDGLVVAGQQWFLDLFFQGPAGPETVRSVLGWAEESLAVESPRGPALAVQRLARKAGWHRLSVRFGPSETEISVDGNDLAHGKGPSGPLAEVRLATFSLGKAEPPAQLAAHFDDLRLVRFPEPAGALEVDAAQDEVRLASGDQVFGTIRAVDADRVTLFVQGREVRLRWSEVAGLYFRRVPVQSQPVSGLLVRLEWRAAPGNDTRDLDQAEGALTAVTAAGLTLDVPYVGPLTVPRDRLLRLKVEGPGERIVIDPTAHHLGNDIVSMPPALDPPQPEGGVLEQTFALVKVPAGPAFLALDVVQVSGEASGLPFSNLVKEGYLRTNVSLNGTAFDYLNRHITTKNEGVERVRLPIPAGLLQPGKNRVRFEQKGTANNPNYLDDLGILGMALEFEPERAPGAPAEREKP